MIHYCEVCGKKLNTCDNILITPQDYRLVCEIHRKFAQIRPGIRFFFAKNKWLFIVTPIFFVVLGVLNYYKLQDTAQFAVYILVIYYIVNY